MSIYALLVAGQVERFDGNLLEVDAKVEEHRGHGKVTAYLFSAESEEEFDRKCLAEKRRTRVDSL
jgi:hypothetical protein